MYVGSHFVSWVPLFTAGVVAQGGSPAAETIIELLNHQSLAHCDLGLHYYSQDERAKVLADEILAMVIHDRPVLVVDDQVNASHHIAVYKHNIKRMSTLGTDSSLDEWCFLRVILVVEASQVEAALSQTQNRLRSMWTGGSMNKNIVFTSDPSFSKDVLIGRFFNSIYSAESLYLVAFRRGASHDGFILHQFDPNRLGNAAGNETILSSKLVTLRTVQLLQKTRRQLFPSFGHDLKGITLTFSLLNWTRTLLVPPDGDGGHAMGEDSFYKNTLETLATRMNFRLRATIPSDGRWGELKPDGSWSGIVRDLESRRADFGPAAFSPERNTVSDAAYALQFDSFTFAMTRPKLVPQWQKVFLPFNGVLTWLAVVFSVLVVGIVLFLMSIVMHDNKRKNLRGLVNFWGDTTFFVVHLFLSKSDRAWSPYKSINWLLLLFSLFTMLILGLYRSSLVSHLTRPTYTSPIDSLEQLADSDLSWGIVNYGSLEAALFSSSSQGIYQRMSQKMEYCTTIEECFERTVDGNFAYITFTDFLINQIEEHFMDRNGKPLLVTAKEVFYTPILLSLALPSASPLLPAVNRYMLLFLDHGLAARWQTVMSEDVKRLGRQNAQKVNKKTEDQSKDNDEDHNKVLALYHLQTAFYILFGGLVIALAVFICELALAKKA